MDLNAIERWNRTHHLLLMSTDLMGNGKTRA